MFPDLNRLPLDFCFLFCSYFYFVGLQSYLFQLKRERAAWNESSPEMEKNLSPVAPSSSTPKDFPSAVNRRRSSESSRENRENGRSLATNQPTVGLCLRSHRHRRRVLLSASSVFFGSGWEFKRGWPSFSFSLSFSLLFSFSSPSVARNHGEVSPSTKGVSTGPERVRSKNRNRKRFSTIFTEFDALPRVRVNRILSMRVKTRNRRIDVITDSQSVKIIK